MPQTTDNKFLALLELHHVMLLLPVSKHNTVNLDALIPSKRIPITCLTLCMCLQRHLSEEPGAEGLVGGLGQGHCAEHAWAGPNSPQERHG